VIVGAYMRLGHLFALQERDAEAVPQFQRELAFLQRIDHAIRSRILVELHVRLGSAQLRLGRREEGQAALGTAREAFEKRLTMGADDPFTRYYGACLYARLGDREAALDSLEKAARGRLAFTVERARQEPELDSVRDDPRFQRLLGSS